MILINDRVVGVIDEVSVANDKEVVRLEFRCKNQVTELFKLTDSTVFINYQNGSTKDRYAVTDLTQDGDYVNFSWTLGANATKKQGKTFFVVCAVITEDEDVVQEWNTELAFFNVNKGLECETQPSEDMEDLFAQLTVMVEENASDISALEGSKQDKLIAGDNITINGNVISATGGSSVQVDEVTLTDDNGTLKVKTGGIDTTQIKDSAVTSDKLATDSVTFTKIKNGQVTEEKLQTACVTTGKIADASITSGKLAQKSVTWQKLADSVTGVISSKQNVLTAGAGISISNDVISATASITFTVVQELPETGNTQTIYLISNGGTTPNIYDEYIYVNNAWEKIGTTDVDLSGYVQTSAIKQTTGQSTTDLMSQDAVTNALSGKANVPLVFSNITVATSDWVADSTYSGLGYKAVLTCSGVTASMQADVYLSSASASLNIVAPFCDEGTDSVTIYSTSNDAITIDKVVAI